MKKMLIILLWLGAMAANAQVKEHDFYRKGRKHREKNDKVLDMLKKEQKIKLRFNKRLSGDFERVDPTNGSLQVLDGKGRKKAFKPGRHYRSKRLGAISITETGLQGYLLDTLSGQAYTLSDTGAVAVKSEVFEQFEPPMAPGVNVPENMPQVTMPGFEADAAIVMSPKVARLYYVVDFQLYQRCGSIQSAVDFTTALQNAVVAFYNPIGIDQKIARIKVYDTPDPWQSFGNIHQLLLFFSNDLANEVGVDLKHLLFFRSASLGGVAYVAGINHPSANTAVSGVTPYITLYTPGGGSGEYNWPIGCVAHEMGHNYGSRHTHWCGWNLPNGTKGRLDSCYAGEAANGVNCGSAIKLPKGGGTLMSYCHITLAGINFNKGFHPSCADVMRQTLAANTTIPVVNQPPPPPSPCLYTYAPTWQACRVNNTQRRDLLIATPAGCVGTPDTVRACVYVPPVVPVTRNIYLIGKAYNATIDSTKFRAIDGNESTRWLASGKVEIRVEYSQITRMDSVFMKSGYWDGKAWRDFNTSLTLTVDGANVTIPFSARFNFAAAVGRSGRLFVFRTTGVSNISRLSEFSVK